MTTWINDTTGSGIATDLATNDPNKTVNVSQADPPGEDGLVPVTTDAGARIVWAPLHGDSEGGTSTAIALRATKSSDSSTVDINVGDAEPPAVGQILTAVSTAPYSAEWQDPNTVSTALATTGSPVTVSTAAAPSVGQILTCTSTSPLAAAWAAPTAPSLGYSTVHAPPSSPDADDLEFEGTSIPSAIRFWDPVSGAAVTSPSAPSAWRTSPGIYGAGVGVDRDSCLTIESPYSPSSPTVSTGIRASHTFTTALSIGNNDRWVWYTRVIMEMNESDAGSNWPDGLNVIALHADSGGNPDPVRYVKWVIAPYQASGYDLNFIASYANGGSDTTIWYQEFNTAAAHGPASYMRRIELCKFGFASSGGGAVIPFFGDEWTQMVRSGGGGTPSINWQPKHAVWQTYRNNNVPACHMNIDYSRIRRSSVAGGALPRIP